MLEHEEETELTDEQREELDLCLSDLEQNPDEGEPWDEVMQSLMNE